MDKPRPIKKYLKANMSFAAPVLEIISNLTSQNLKERINLKEILFIPSLGGTQNSREKMW